MVRFLTLLTLVLFSVSEILAQTTGSVQGKVTDASTGETLPFANVVVQKDGQQVAGTSTDFDGNYNFSNISAGTYTLEVSYIGYPKLQVTDVVVKIGQVMKVNLEYPESDDPGGVDVFDSMQVVVVAHKIPLIEQDNTTGGQTLGAKDISHMATRNVNSIAATTAGVNQSDEGEELNANGGRSSGNDVYIDGVRVVGNFGIPETEIEQVQIITSGVPAEFGDATGAITNIITKGPSSKFTGGVQAETSQFLDAFGANRADLYFAGPIIAKPMTQVNDKGGIDTIKTDDGEVRKKVILGYRFAGTINTVKDSRASALPSYKVHEDSLYKYMDSPLRMSPNGGLVLATDYMTEDDLEYTAVRPNARESFAIANFKVDFKPTNDFYFVAGGQMQYSWGKSAGVTNRLLNYQYNSDYRNSTWRAYGRFRHTVSSTTPQDDGGGDTSATRKLAPAFQNFSYELQGDYTRTDFQQHDPRYRDRLFEYGYIGKIQRHLEPVGGIIDTNFIVNSVGDTIGEEPVYGHFAYNISFDGYEADPNINPGLASYNDLLDFNDITTMEEMEIVNGRFIGNRLSAYGLYNSPFNTGGSTAAGSSYGKSNTSQVRANIKANFDLVTNQKTGDPIRHQVQLGGTYEQRVERNYSISPFGLWNLADQSANTHLDFATDSERPDGGEFFDPFTQRFYDTYDPLIRTDEDGELVQMTQFGEKVREVAGQGQYDWVNVHEMTPDQLSLDMFEPTTLILGRQRIMEYYGYDYLGNPTGTNVQFNDFFSEEDANGRKTRPIGPNRPIYIAGYIQDKFTYKDIICRFGVRFDSYDANTKVLKDPYSIAGYYTASEFENATSGYTAAQSADYVRPSNIGDDYVVYVGENSSDASVAGFRLGEEWYDENGLPVSSPSELGATIVPALQGFSSSINDPQGENYDPDAAFRDYKPTLVVMPRLAFSFPISKEANFYANYDVLAQRPPSATIATPYTYFNFREIATGNPGYINNPNLKSQRTINYEIGFQQKLNDYSKVKLSVLYREERNLIQLRDYIAAYPLTYTSYGNDDFSTVKAFKLEYDLRENKNIRVLANYTLAFAEGTGSSPTSSSGVAAEELKYIFPLNFDQRHTFYLNLDYRFKSGSKYNGPKIYSKNKKDSTKTGRAIDILENTGLNVAFNVASGTPYTSKQVPGGIGTSFPNRITEGSINGARLPWNFRIDLRLDRDIVINKNKKNPVHINIYLRVQNLLNTRNVLSVYPVTGSPVDDGFLTIEGSPGLNLLTSNEASYNLLYNLRMNNPFNISRPRRIFLGARVAF